MKREIKAPSVGESITEVRIGRWAKQNGEAVKTGDVLLEIESDKATVEVVAEFTGALSTTRQVGDTVKIGEVLGFIEEGASGTVSASAPSANASAPSVSASAASKTPDGTPLSPAVRKMTTEAGIDASQISGTGRGGRVTKGDVIAHQEGGAPKAQVAVPAAQTVTTTDGRERRVPMTLLRQKIAERLVQAQHTAAILTTFNECDMTEVNAVRAKHKDSFKAKNGVGLSFMSFFTRAVVEALKAVPAVNAMIDGKDIVYRDYLDRKSVV